MSKCFGVQKRFEYFSLHITFINCSLHARCSLSLTDRVKRISVTELCSINYKIVKCLLTYGLSINCPRKYWPTDRRPNRTWTFSELRKFRTPIYTSTLDVRQVPILQHSCAASDAAGLPPTAHKLSENYYMETRRWFAVNMTPLSPPYLLEIPSHWLRVQSTVDLSLSSFSWLHNRSWVCWSSQKNVTEK